MNDRERVEMFKPMVRFVAAVCGPKCTVELHCLDDIEHSLIAVENGYITDGQVGDGLMESVLDALMNEVNDGREYSINTPGKTTLNGRDVRFMSYFIRDDGGRLVGLMNVIFDVTELVRVRELIDERLCCSPESVADRKHGVSPISAADMVNSAFSEAMEQMGFFAPEMMRKDDKLKIIGMLDARNMFALKGAVSVTAKLLRLSEPSVYRYIQECNKKSSAN